MSATTGERVRHSRRRALQPGEWFISIGSGRFAFTGRGCGSSTRRPRALVLRRPGERHRLPFFQLAPGNWDESAPVLFAGFGKDTPDVMPPRSMRRCCRATADARRANAAAISCRPSAANARPCKWLIGAMGGVEHILAVAGASWSTVRVPARPVTISRSIYIPSPFPTLELLAGGPGPIAAATGHRITFKTDRLQLTVFPTPVITRRRCQAEPQWSRFS
jgi:hypothetical protein